MKQGIGIKVNNKHEALQAAKLIHEVNGKPYYSNNMDDYYGPVEYVCVDNKDIFFSSYDKEETLKTWDLIRIFDISEVGDIIEFLKNPTPPKEYKVEDVGSYTAEITMCGVEVGCQTISFDKVREIMKMIEEFEQDNQVD